MLVCPISKDHVDEHVARMNGFVSLILLGLGFYFYPIWIYLIVDYYLRAYKRKYSPTARLNQLILNKLNIEAKPINAAPKKFAAQIGLTMSILLFASLYVNVSAIRYGVASFFALAMFLESVFNYCLGCEMYSILVSLKIIKIEELDK